MSIDVLKGVKVVELSNYVAAPIAGRILADWGADVIKIEEIEGDLVRGTGAVYNMTLTDEENALFQHVNANKTIISLNVRTEKGKEIIHRLLADADVFLSNIRIGSLEKLGLGYEALKKSHPRLIFAHVNGFGYEGPAANRPGFDVAAFWARSGVLIDWSDRGHFPVKPTGAFGDMITGSNVLSAVLAALYNREKTGKGAWVTTSLYASSVWCNATLVMATQEPYNIDFPKSRWAPSYPFSHIFETKDGEWIMMQEFEHKKFAKYCRIFGLEDCINDERYNTVAALRQGNHMREMIEKINEAFRQRTLEEWFKILDENDMVYSHVARSRDVSKDPQAWANDMLREVHYPTTGNKIAMPVSPIRFVGVKNDRFNMPRGIGQDTKKVLTSLGYTPEEISSMEDEKAIRCSK